MSCLGFISVAADKGGAHSGELGSQQQHRTFRESVQRQVETASKQLMSCSVVGGDAGSCVGCGRTVDSVE